MSSCGTSENTDIIFSAYPFSPDIAPYSEALKFYFKSLGVKSKLE